MSVYFMLYSIHIQTGVTQSILILSSSLHVLYNTSPSRGWLRWMQSVGLPPEDLFPKMSVTWHFMTCIDFIQVPEDEGYWTPLVACGTRHIHVPEAVWLSERCFDREEKCETQHVSNLYMKWGTQVQSLTRGNDVTLNCSKFFEQTAQSWCI